MTEHRSPLAAGLKAILEHRRLAGVLWLGLLVSALPAWFAFGGLFGAVDGGPFRESLLRGWDSWAFLSFVGANERGIKVAFAAIGLGLLLSLLLDLLLTTGAVRVLLSGLPRPVLRRTVAEGAALFRPVAWAFARYVVSLALWIGLLVAAPVALLTKAAGKTPPPNGPLATLALAWGVVAAVVVLANVNLRFNLARVALARGAAPDARRAYRVAKAVLRGARARGIGLWLFWLLAGAAIQVAFTALGVRMNPGTGAGVAALVLVRQAGFLLLAATRVGYQASLVSFEESRRPLPPLPLEHPVTRAPEVPPVAAAADSPAAPAPKAPEAA